MQKTPKNRSKMIKNGKKSLKIVKKHDFCEKIVFFGLYFNGMGLHRLQALSATRPQLKQMKAGFLVTSMI